MSAANLVILGSSSQTPTRARNHNGYLVRLGREQILVDPGEGTQRQFTLLGVKASKVTRIAITHVHGDHCLGLPGMLARLTMDRVSGPVGLHFPVEAQRNIDHLRGGPAVEAEVPITEHPMSDGEVITTPTITVTGRALDHRIPTLGWRFDEPERRTMRAEVLEERGIEGQAIGRLQRDGEITIAGRRTTLEEASMPRPGRSIAVVMDTRDCAGARELAADVDLLLCEATYTDEHADLADTYAHLTARQAGAIAQDAGARQLVLTHFSQRYRDTTVSVREATEAYAGPITVADDGTEVSITA